jgi:hypothetical protein
MTDVKQECLRPRSETVTIASDAPIRGRDAARLRVGRRQACEELPEICEWQSDLVACARDDCPLAGQPAEFEDCVVWCSLELECLFVQTEEEFARANALAELRGEPTGCD